jgi:glutamate formiminotransferase
MRLQVLKVLLYWILIQDYQQIEQFIVKNIGVNKIYLNFFFLIAFVGHPQAVIEAAMAAARSAYNLIDMTRHSGEHPRVGAMVISK